MQRHSQLLISTHVGRSSGDKPALAVADLRHCRVVNDIHSRRQRLHDRGERLGTIEGGEGDLHLQGVARIRGRQGQSRQRLFCLALSVEPKRPARRDKAAHPAEQANNADPRRGQPFGKLHSSSPVLPDSCTVEAPGEGVTPLSALVGGAS